MASYTTESILAALGYPDPLTAARQQARMILLGRLARYQAEIRHVENQRGENLAELRAHYIAKNQELFCRGRGLSGLAMVSRRH